MRAFKYETSDELVYRRSFPSTSSVPGRERRAGSPRARPAALQDRVRGSGEGGCADGDKVSINRQVVDFHTLSKAGLKTKLPQAVFVQPGVELGGAGEAQEAGGAALVATALDHGLLDETPLHLLQLDAPGG